MKKIGITALLLGAVALTGFLLVNSVSAAGFFAKQGVLNETKIEHMAERFDLDPADINNAIEEGTLREFLGEAGIQPPMRGHGKGGVLETKAEILGMTAEELMEAQNSCFCNLIEEQGLTKEEFQNQMHEVMQEKAVERMQQQGLTDAEIQTRLERMEERCQNGNCEFLGEFQ